MWLGHAIYLLVFLALTLLVPGRIMENGGGLLIAVGAIGAWRYSWALSNFIRAIIYINVVYPRSRRQALRTYRERAPAHAYFLVTSYGFESATTISVYRALFRAAARSPGGATVIASVVDVADERLLRRLGAGSALQMVQLIVDRIPGTGKRNALARSLQSIRRLSPGSQDIVVLVDGDTCVPADIVERSAPFFTQSGVGALTTDEHAQIPPSLFAEWYGLRFAQRQMMMSSMALSGRVLTLTGRMSVFRADLATDPDFIASVQDDRISHWRLGQIRLLTGDDKSTWYWLLCRGHKMCYLPDVQAISMEAQPRPSFVVSVATLMVRWFGNMLRINRRALRISPLRIGPFIWWSLLDQKISIWTTLVGPIGALVATVLVDHAILPAYLAWVMATRYVNCMVLASFRRRLFPISYPFLLYFSQVGGALIKSFVLFRLDRQKWTRQPNRGGERRSPVRRFSSDYMHALALGWFLTLLVLLIVPQA